MPLRSYPSALEVEVQDPTSGMQHTRWCGAWIYAHAGGVRDATLYYRFTTRRTPRLPWKRPRSSTPAVALPRRCWQILRGVHADGARRRRRHRAAARLAYADLKPTLTGGNRAAALRALGRPRRPCPGPLQLGIGVDAGKGVFPAAVRSALFAEGNLARALFVMESAAMQLDAEAQT